MILYRGQIKDYPLKPSGYRDIPPESELNIFSSSLVKQSEFFISDYRIVAYLTFEIFNNYNLCYEPKMPEFRAFLKTSNKDTLINEIDKFFIEFLNINTGGYILNDFLEDLSFFQHYGKKTPMLDFTVDFNSALKFSGIDTTTRVEDGFLLIKDFPIQIGEKSTLFVFCPELFYEKSSPWLFSYPYAWDVLKINKNIQNQEGVCIFCPPSNDDNLFLFKNCYQVYNIFLKERIGASLFKLKITMLDECFNIETLYKFGCFSNEIYKDKLIELKKKYNIKENLENIKISEKNE